MEDTNVKGLVEKYISLVRELESLEEDIVEHYADKVAPESLEFMESILENVTMFPSTDACMAVIDSFVSACPMEKPQKKKRPAATKK